MQLGQYLDFFIESIKAAGAKVVAANQKATSAKMLVCKALG